MGAIYKRRNTYWLKYYRVGPDGRSKPIYESAKTSDPNEARALLREREGARAQGASTQTVRIERVTFDEAAELVLRKYRKNGQRSIGHAQRYLERHLAPAFRGRVLVTITEADWSAYQDARQSAGASNATINRERSILVLAFHLAKVPCPRFDRLREAKPRRGFFEREQLEAVLRNLPEDRADAVRFAYETGWRRGEYLGGKDSGQSPLAWRNVSFEGRGEVRIEDTKSDEPRVFPLTKELRTVLERCRGRVSAAERRLSKVIPYVFIRESTGEPIRSFYKSWKRACRAAGVPGKLLHDFRRTAVRNLEREGVPRSVAMKLTGHKTESVHKRYGIVSEGDLQLAAERIDQRRAR